MTWFFLNLVFCSALGFALAYLAVRLFFASKRGSNIVIEKLKTAITQKIQSFLDKVKEQIPLSKMVLQGEMERKLKRQAENEMIEAIPELEKTVALPIGILGAAIGFSVGLIEWLLI